MRRIKNGDTPVQLRSNKHWSNDVIRMTDDDEEPFLHFRWHFYMCSLRFAGISHHDPWYSVFFDLCRVHIRRVSFCSSRVACLVRVSEPNNFAGYGTTFQCATTALLRESEMLWVMSGKKLVSVLFFMRSVLDSQHPLMQQSQCHFLAPGSFYSL